MTQRRARRGRTIHTGGFQPHDLSSNSGRQSQWLVTFAEWGYQPSDEGVAAAGMRLLRMVEFGVEPTRILMDFLVHDERVARANREQESIMAAEVRSAPVVYFIRGHGRVKIGYTTDLKKRLSAMSQPPDVVMATIPGGRETELALHQRFADARIGRSEWFHLTPVIEAFIAAAA